jgi:Tfp pilus assembly protein FimT
MRSRRQSGFSVLELMLVALIILIVMGMSAPKMSQLIDNQKLQTSAQAYAGLLQEARARAVEDDRPYEVLVDTSSGTPIAYVDLNDDGQYNPTGTPPEPGVLLARPITVSDTGLPTATNGFDTIHPLNIIPLHDSTSPMLASDPGGTPRPGLAFNQRGLPCQRFAAGGNCVNAIPPQTPPLPPQVAWVTYFQFALRNGGKNYAAISVTPAGRIKTWSFQSDGQGGGTWY